MKKGGARPCFCQRALAPPQNKDCCYRPLGSHICNPTSGPQTQSRRVSAWETSSVLPSVLRPLQVRGPVFSARRSTTRTARRGRPSRPFRALSDRLAGPLEMPQLSAGLYRLSGLSYSPISGTLLSPFCRGSRVTWRKIESLTAKRLVPPNVRSAIRHLPTPPRATNEPSIA